MPDHVTICEVGPRDGLQNESKLVSVDDRARLIDLLSATGLRYIEAASFVSPKWVPQMADGGNVLARIARKPGVVYSALTPNLMGYDAAKVARVGEVAVFASASETFSQKNINCTIDESLARYAAICQKAATDKMPVRGYVSCVVACPYEGAIAPQAVRRVAASLINMGCREISLGDTIGVASPRDIAALLDNVLAGIPVAKIAGHFHDTRGLALDCIQAALDYGVRVFDASVAGAGGCPFAPGAKGNVATHKVVEMLEGQGFTTGINASTLAEASDFMLQILGHKP
ncbi:MAG: hydroxymethylglutaryl-CoA lyase [Aestuariivirga sp.]